MTRTILLTLVAFFGLASVSSSVAQDRHEHIMVSGGPALLSWEKLRFPRDQHDKWNLNFIRPVSWARIPQLQKIYGKDAMITWLVYRPAYERRQREDGDPLISWIQSVIRKYPTVRLVWFSKGDDVINYINNGQNRRRVKIGSIDFFLHSNRHCFMFDYSNEILGCSKEFLHEDELHKLKRSAFAKTAQSKSWGCHTGESMSKKWRKATGTKLWGAVGKTDYGKMRFNGWLPAVNGSWSY